MRVRNGLYFLFALLAAVLIAAAAPLEQTLGASARLIYLHGAWVWAAMLAFTASALVALAALLRRPALHAWALGLGRAGLVFWVVFLVQSLYLMQANWNGLFLDEPRFRLPFNFAVAGLLLHIGLAFLPVGRWSSLGCLLFGAALLVGMGQADAVLHPESPIFQSGSGAIQAFFGALVFTLTLAAWQLGALFVPGQPRSPGRAVKTHA
jgi:hypothetical protein